MMLAFSLSWVFTLPLALAQQGHSCPVLLQGQTVGEDEFAQLPVGANTEGADHMLIRMNARGDALVVWQSKRTLSPSTFTWQAEGVYLEYNQDPVSPEWTVGASLMLGDPTLGLWAAAGGQGPDACIKPNIVPMGDDFMVTWPRVDAGRAARWFIVEAVYVEAPSTAGTPPTVHYYENATGPVVGQGHLVTDGQTPLYYIAQESGETVGADELRNHPTLLADESAVLVHMNWVNSTTYPLSVEVDHEYELYAWTVDYSDPSSPVFQHLESDQTPTGRTCLLADIYVDDLGQGYQGAGSSLCA